MELSKKRRNILVVLISFIVGIANYFPYIRISFYDQTIAAFNLTHTQLGNLGSMYGLAGIGCFFVGGILAQKYSARVLVVISMMGMAVVNLWMATFPSYEVMAVIYFLYAVFGNGTLWSSYLVLLRSFGSDAEQGRLFGISESLRSVLASVLGFLFISVFGLFTTEAGGYRTVLIIGSAFYFLLGVLAFFALPRGKGAELDREKNRTSERASVLAAIKLPGVWLTGIFIFSCYMLIAGGAFYLGTYTTQILHTSTTVSSALQVIRTYVLAIGLGVVGGIAIDRFQYRARFLIMSVAVVGIACICMPFLSNYFWVAIIVSVLISAMNYMIKSVYYSIMDEALIPRALTGAATGIISVIAYSPDAFLGSIVGPWLDADPVSGFNKLFILLAFWAAIAIIMAIIINIRYIKHEKQSKTILENTTGGIL